MTRPWMKYIPESEVQMLERVGFMSGLEITGKAALLVVDATYGFIGRKGKTLAAAIQEYPTACGPAAWEAIPKMAALIGLFREKGLPIVFTYSDGYDSEFSGKATKLKTTRSLQSLEGFNDFPDEIKPLPAEWVMGKAKPSAFFQTSLPAYLVRSNVQTVVICGVTTSGCVRATAVDCSSHGYTTLVVDDCCFDRSEFSHASNLFDLQAKYAGVLSVAELEELLVKA